ncbi:MAG: hypothetical protein U9N53_09540 [Bacteroidota bacterium]|nr:hypothetical protein [Bacteroidota bacterium]
MKTKYFIPLILGIILIISFSNCNKETVTKFLIEVDSIVMADTILLSETLNVALYGTIGNTGCYEFSNLEFEQIDTTIIMEVWGKKTESKDLDCPEMLVMLDGAVVEITFINPGTYVIEVKLPDNRKLSEPVVVISP